MGVAWEELSPCERCRVMDTEGVVKQWPCTELTAQPAWAHLPGVATLRRCVLMLESSLL